MPSDKDGRERKRLKRTDDNDDVDDGFWYRSDDSGMIIIMTDNDGKRNSNAENEKLLILSTYSRM